MLPCVSDNNPSCVCVSPVCLCKATDYLCTGRLEPKSMSPTVGRWVRLFLLTRVPISCGTKLKPSCFRLSDCFWSWASHFPGFRKARSFPAVKLKLDEWKQESEDVYVDWLLQTFFSISFVNLKISGKWLFGEFWPMSDASKVLKSTIILKEAPSEHTGPDVGPFQKNPGSLWWGSIQTHLQIHQARKVKAINRSRSLREL